MAWLGNARCPALRRQRARSAEFRLVKACVGCLLVCYTPLARSGFAPFCPRARQRSTCHELDWRRAHLARSGSLRFQARAITRRFEAVTAALRQRMASSSYFDEEEPSEPFHCTICMTELPRWPADACVLKPCGHHFHLECATRWMDRESSCPNCKSSVETIAKSGRSKRRRSEIAVEPKRQSVAEQDMELPDAETQLEAPPSEGYQRDGFVVGDDDVEFYSSEEERARAAKKKRLAQRNQVLKVEALDLTVSDHFRPH